MEKWKDEKMEEHLAVFKSVSPKNEIYGKGSAVHRKKEKKNGEKEKMKLDLWF